MKALDNGQLLPNSNREKATEFVHPYYVNLNAQTKAFFYANLLDITDMRLAEPRKIDDLMKMILVTLTLQNHLLVKKIKGLFECCEYLK